MASIGEGDYQVVKKKSLVLFTVCLFFCSSESFEKFGLTPEKKLEENSGRASKNLASRQKKKLEENSGPDPLI
jgi:hypothetical protein